MRLWLITLLMYSSLAVSASDPIDRLVQSLPSNGLWTNGLFPKIMLPATADASQVIAECMVGAHIEKYSILEIRDVAVAGLSVKYLAVLVDSTAGQKIVLMQYASPASGWWTRIYDAK